MTGEFIMDKIDRAIEAFRQCYSMPTQVVSFGKVYYVFVAVKSAKDERHVNYYFTSQWRGVKGLLLLFTELNLNV